MLGQGSHSTQTPADGIHGVVSFVYPDEATRLAATGFVDPDDLYKVAFQEDTNELFWIQQIDPSVQWQPVGNASVLQRLDKVRVRALKASAGTINIGEAVYLYDGDGPDADLLVEKAQADSLATLPAVGVAEEQFTETTPGFVMVTGGIFGGIDTSSWSPNTPLYVSATVAGGLTDTPPSGPFPVQAVGVSGKQSSTEGEMAVGITALRALSNDDPQTIGTSASPGTSSVASRSDHSHPHGEQSDEDLHSTATQFLNGFFSSVDKTKLDTIDYDATEDTKEVKVSSDDTTPDFLANKLTAGEAVTISEQNGGGDESLQISGPVFGRDYQSVVDENTATTSSTTFQTRVTLNTPTLTGTYRVGWQVKIGANDDQNDTEARLRDTTAGVTLDNTVIEPKDTENRYAVGGAVEVVFSNESKTFTVDFRTADGWDTAIIDKARIEFWRVS